MMEYVLARMVSLTGAGNQLGDAVFDRHNRWLIPWICARSKYADPWWYRLWRRIQHALWMQYLVSVKGINADDLRYVWRYQPPTKACIEWAQKAAAAGGWSQPQDKDSANA